MFKVSGSLTHSDISLLWFEVPLHGGRHVSIEPNLEGSILHRLHLTDRLICLRLAHCSTVAVCLYIFICG